MSNDSGPWRKFAQTFFLAEQPNGYFVLNDIFRFLKEDTVADEEEDAAEETVDGYDKLEESVPVAVPESKIEVAEKEEPVVPLQQEEVPKAAEQKIVETPAAAPVKEEVTKSVVEEVSKDVATPAPAPVANGSAEKAATPVAEAAPVEVAAPVETPAAPAQKATPPPAAATPSKPAAPPAPKTWASLAKGAAGAWGKPAPAPSPAAPAAAPKPAAPAAAAPAAAAPTAPAPQAPTGPKKSAAAEAALAVTTSHCFIKVHSFTLLANPQSASADVHLNTSAIRQLANWAATNADRNETLDPERLRAALEARFGKVLDLEIVKTKACAFLEFESIASARQAILASLPVNQGGEGGVKVEDGRVLVETRKEKDQRGPPRGGPRSLQQGGNPTFNAQGQQGAGRGGRGGMQQGRGGARGGRPPVAPAAK